jgi:uncharacterized protein (DUF169 family)
MDKALKAKFIELWIRYFNAAELPLAFYYSDQADNADRVPSPSAHICMIGVLARARKGASLYFDADSIGCRGGKRYTGFTEEIIPQFEHFLSCGIPGSSKVNVIKKLRKSSRKW